MAVVIVIPFGDGISGVLSSASSDGDLVVVVIHVSDCLGWWNSWWPVKQAVAVVAVIGEIGGGLWNLVEEASGNQTQLWQQQQLMKLVVKTLTVGG